MHRTIVLLLGTAGTWCATAPANAQSVHGDADPEVTLLDRVEVTATPIPGTLVDADDLPYTVQTATDEDIAAAHATNLTDFAVRRLNGVNSNEVQGSPFQTDITFHGFRASALPGASQGVSVYLDGVRINEPFADIVSWDMVPEAAIRSLTLMPGSNPLYGPNTLGGALAFTTKSGLTDPGFEGDLSYGSDDRKRLDASWGYAADNGVHALVATTLFDEDGWRDASEGHTGSVFAKIGRDGESSDWDISVLHGRSRLIGNGLLPSWRYTDEGGDEGREPGLYEMDRRAVFTSPDLTRNRNTMVTAQFDHAFDDDNRLHLLAYHRQGKRDTVNGDLSEDYEEFVEECGDGFDADGEPLDDDCDVTAGEADEIPSGVFNTTSMRQRAAGFAAYMSHRLGAHQLGYGLTYDWSRVRYDQFEQDGMVDDARAIQAIPGGEREFFSGVRGSTHAVGLFVSDLWRLGEATFLNAALRWNQVGVKNILSTAEDGTLAPEKFTYTKANPAIGITHKFGDGFAVFASVSQNSRAPTAIELGCADPEQPCRLPTGLQASSIAVFASVSQNSRAPTAIELGCADPEQPCRLPTGLQADPYLKQIVSRTYEVGMRWNPGSRQSLNASVYRADNRDDILFLRAPNTQQGYFDNVDRTRYQGVDLQYIQQLGAFDLYAAYSYLDATYQTHGELLSGERIIELEPGMRIAGLPRNTVKLGMDWHASEAFTLGADLQALSRRVATGNEDGLVANLEGEEGEEDDEVLDPADLRHDLSTAGYALVNLHAVWKLDDRFSFYARFNNVFDRRYETYAAIAEDLFPDGELARPQDGPVEEGPSRFVAPGASRQFVVGVRMKF